MALRGDAIQRWPARLSRRSTELPWKLLAGTPGARTRFVEIQGVRHVLGQASGEGYNGLLYSLRQ